MASARTKPGTQKLSEVARKVVAPDGIATTGWPAVRDTCEKKLGITFDAWQHGAGRLILAKRADGKLACMIGGVGMSLPRQVGKTYLIGALVFALCIQRPGMLIIWSAHHAKTHGETFLAMQAFADRLRVRPYIEQVFKGSGDEEIRFRNGSRILFGARERGFGRGIPGVDMIVSDEAQIMSDKALDAQLATMNVSPFGLAIYIGTPPRPDDPSEAFTRMRRDAWAGTMQDSVWIEFGVERGSDPNDRKAWAKANPSFPHRTPVESILRLQRKLKPDSFLREGLGIWDEDAGGALSYSLWEAGYDPKAKRGTAAVVGLDVAGDAGWVCVAWARPDGGAHLMLLCDGESVPAHRAAAEAASAAKAFKAKVACTKGIEADVQDAGAQTVRLTSEDFTTACGGFDRALAAGTIHHGNQPALNAAVKAAKWRSAGTGGERAFQLKDMPEVGPLAAAVRALHGLARQADYDVLSSAY